MHTEDIIFGRNTVLDALKNSDRVEKVFIQKGETQGSINEIKKLVKEKKIPIIEADRKKLDELVKKADSKYTSNHQGIVAYVTDFEYCEVEDILEFAKSKNEPPFILILDGITDAQNYGAIIRSAEVFGVHGIIIAKRNSAPVNSAVCKISCGAVENIKIAKVANLNSAVEKLKKENIWVYCGVTDGQPVSECDFSGGCAIVVGSEGEGVSQLIQKNCDHLVTIPMYGKTNSLNASVAAAILMYESTKHKAQSTKHKYL